MSRFRGSSFWMLTGSPPCQCLVLALSPWNILQKHVYLVEKKKKESTLWFHAECTKSSIMHVTTVQVAISYKKNDTRSNLRGALVPAPF